MRTVLYYQQYVSYCLRLNNLNTLTEAYISV